MTTARKAERLHWIKFNPTEWLGMFPELNDEEYGLLHRVIAKLWSIPGNRMPLDALLAELRLRPDSHRAEVLRGLVGYALRADDAGALYIPALDEAFADVVRRSTNGKTAAGKRWGQGEAAAAPSKVDPTDF